MLRGHAHSGGEMPKSGHDASTVRSIVLGVVRCAVAVREAVMKVVDRVKTGVRFIGGLFADKKVVDKSECVDDVVTPVNKIEGMCTESIAPTSEVVHSICTVKSVFKHVARIEGVRDQQTEKDKLRLYLPEPVVEAPAARSQAAAIAFIEKKVRGRVVAPTKDELTHGAKARGFKDTMSAAAVRRESARVEHVSRIRIARAARTDRSL